MPKIREVLLTQRILYVSPNGNDNNKGLDPSEAFRTVNKAIRALSLTDHAEYSGRIVLDAGEYSGFDLENYEGLNSLSLTGQGPSTIIDSLIRAENLCYPWLIENLLIEVATFHSIQIINSKQVKLRGLTFSIVGNLAALIRAERGSEIDLEAAQVRIQQNGGQVDSFLSCEDQSRAFCRNIDLGLAGVSTYRDAFLALDNLSLIRWLTPVVVGTALGLKVSISGSSILDLGGLGLSAVPGTGLSVADGGRILGNGSIGYAIGAPPLRLQSYGGDYAEGAFTGKPLGAAIVVLKGDEVSYTEGEGVEGELQITPESFDFGSVEAGDSSPAIAFLLKNIGTRPLTVAELSISAGVSGDFAIADVDCGTTPFSIAGGRACSVSITFTPTAIENLQTEQIRNAKLIVETSKAVVEANLVGKVLSTLPRLEVVLPDNLSGVAVQQGTTGTPIYASIRNAGKVPLTVANIGLTGKDLPAFAFSLTPAIAPFGIPPRSLNPGEFYNVTLTPTPPVESATVTTDITKTVNIEVLPQDADVTPVRKTVSYLAVRPRPSLLVSPSDFIAASANLTKTTSVTILVTLLNNGQGELTVFAIEPTETTYPAPVVSYTAQITSVGGVVLDTVETSTNVLKGRISPNTISIAPVTPDTVLPPWKIAAGQGKSFEVQIKGVTLSSMITAEASGKWVDPAAVNTLIRQLFTVAMLDFVVIHNDPLTGGAVEDSSSQYESRITISATCDMR